MTDKPWPDRSIEYRMAIRGQGYVTGGVAVPPDQDCADAAERLRELERQVAALRTQRSQDSKALTLLLASIASRK